MVGIEPLNSNKWDDSFCDDFYEEALRNKTSLYAKAVRVKPSSDFSCYSIILFNRKTDENLNERLVLENYAAFKPETKHHILNLDLHFSEDSHNESYGETSDVTSNESDWDHINESYRPFVPKTSTDVEIATSSAPSTEQMFSWPSDYELDEDLFDIVDLDELVTQAIQNEKQSNGAVTDRDQHHNALMPAPNTDSSAAQNDRVFIDEEGHSIAKVHSEKPVPQLSYIAKVPSVIWNQSTSLVVLSVAAYDNVEYDLKVSSDMLMLW